MADDFVCEGKEAIGREVRIVKGAVIRVHVERGFLVIGRQIEMFDVRPRRALTGICHRQSGKILQLGRLPLAW